MGRQLRLPLTEPLGTALARLRDAYERREVMTDDLLSGVLGELDRLPPEAVAWADGRVADLAGLSHRYDRRLWPSLFRPDRSQLSLAERPELAFLFLFHHDGYLREAALHVLPAVHSPFFLAAVAWRLNDWVPEVRLAARRCAERLFPTAPAAIFVAIAPFLLDRRQRSGRWEPEAAALIDQALSRPEVTAGLVERLRSEPTGRLPTLLRQLLRPGALDAHLAGLAVGARQPGVRAVALQALLRGRASWLAGFERVWIDKRYGLSRRRTVFAHRPIDHAQDLETLVSIGVRDRSPIVRGALAAALVERHSELPHFAEAIAALRSDPSPAVRHRAEFLAQKKADEDAAAAPAKTVAESSP